jgi:hypothetical protein
VLQLWLSLLLVLLSLVVLLPRAAPSFSCLLLFLVLLLARAAPYLFCLLLVVLLLVLLLTRAASSLSCRLLVVIFAGFAAGGGFHPVFRGLLQSGPDL